MKDKGGTAVVLDFMSPKMEHMDEETPMEEEAEGPGGEDAESMIADIQARLDKLRAMMGGM